MALRTIRQYGDDILQKKAKPVQIFDDVLHLLLDDMWDTLREHEGLGMAAPQVGILRRAIVIELDDDIYEIINPVIIESRGCEVKSEACLSVPNKQGDVERPTYIKLEAADRNGEPYVVESDNDMLVTAICHEIDHLDGILFLDKAIKIQDRPDEEIVKAKRAKRAKKAKMNKADKKGEKTKKHKIHSIKRAVGQ